MGGRGASSGVSSKGKAYGTEYQTVYQSGNIKFVERKDNSANTPMETMTSGRVYVTVNKNGDLKSISYYDKHNKRYKQIDVSHSHFIDGKPINPHTHKGYLHNEKGDYVLSEKEQKMVERVQTVWYNKRNKQ